MSASVPGRSDLDPVRLARSKAASGITTSVVIPARDEGTRIGAVVAAVRRAMEPVAGVGVALVDEVVVVDGSSSDDTVAEAMRAGARVVHQRIEDDGPSGTSAGTSAGKGAALRLGVASTSGDLVAFVDADVIDPDPWLAVGTLAPLLVDPALRLVKSAASRSWEGGSGDGGGRVTELTVRPLLALLWPEIASIVQPLAGEYAADRDLLEGLPFERGYGVELGILLDTYRLFGPDVIGQVDLGVRGHTHQPLAALSRMAAELLLVVTHRLALEGRGLSPDLITTTLAVPRAGRDADGLRLTVDEVSRAALAPLVSGGPRPRRRGPSPSS